MSPAPCCKSRRDMLRASVAVLCCSAAGPSLAQAAPNVVDQITDPAATAASGMFRFEPDLLTLHPGAELAFLNSKSHHTVHSVPELWPEQAPLVSIAHSPEVVVTFDHEGFYGFRCKRHGQYGMVMLVIVGDPSNLIEARAKVSTMKAKPREKEGFLKLFDRYAAERT